MNFFSVGRISNYTKSMDMQSKWQKKKNSGDFTADGISGMSEWSRKKQADIRQAADIYCASKQNNDEKLSAIHSKIQQGSSLTADEMSYLKSKDFVTYQRLKRNQNETESYEKSLKQCKSKEEVQKLKLQHINSGIMELKSIENNPNVSDGDKLAVAYSCQQKISSLNKATQKFIESGAYAKLPSDAEINKAHEDLEQAEKNELRNISSAERENDSEKNVDLKIGCDDEKEHMTRTDAELSEEARKVRRSKIKNTYIRMINDGSSNLPEFRKYYKEPQDIRG